jgi:branched-chain amino acid transport system substrate-binding protein
MVKKSLVLLLVLSLVATLFVGCARGGSDLSNVTEIKIGAIQPISGDISAFGTQSRDAINLAVEEINANGGVLGKPLKAIVEDDEGNPEKSLTALTKLATQDNVVGIIGALTSKCSLAINAEAQKRKLVMISPSSTNEKVTDAGDFIFRSCFIDPFQGTVNAKFAFDSLKAKKAAVMFDNSNDYSKGLKDTFIAKFKELGGEVVAEEAYGKDDKDFNAQLTKIKGYEPDVLFIPDYYNKVALIAKQARNQGITATMLGGDGWEAIAKNAGDEIVGSYYSNHYTPGADDQEVAKFVEAYKAKYNVEPNALAALAYDATYILADAIARADSIDSAKIRDEVAKTDKKFVTGQIKYDEKRNPVKSAVMIKLEKDDSGALKEVYAETVNP